LLRKNSQRDSVLKKLMLQKKILCICASVTRILRILLIITDKAPLARGFFMLPQLINIAAQNSQRDLLRIKN
jgi:hypothetical protein